MEKLTFSGSPHIRCKLTTKQIMLDVVIALLPACVVGCVIFGLQALLILCIAAVAAVVTEIVYNLIFNKMKFKETLKAFDFTSLVTGVLIGMNMPPRVEWYVPLLASIFAIAVVKMLFGGTGKNLFNPAIAGRIFAFLSFTAMMTKAENYAAGSIILQSGATPLTDLLNTGSTGSITILQMFIGDIPGCIGETSAAALIIGGIYLAIRGVIDLRFPAIFIAVAGLLSVAMNGFNWSLFLPSILGGGLMLGAIFMATDYVTTPNTKLANYIYFACLGLLTVILRYSKATDRIEACSFAIMMMNITVPLFDKFFVKKPFGFVKVKKLKKEDAKK
ncbi:MAG: RnfABCDGE type electron transport complex subunit D [Clostridia bacterium]